MYSTKRGSGFCRGCGSTSINSVLNLGLQPIANELAKSLEDQKTKFPLELFSCMECGLGQVGEVLLPEEIFVDYPYLSSMSTAWLTHSKNYAETQTKDLNLNADNWVLEIASNDGYLLGEFNKLKVRTLGVEPAGNVAEIAREKGIETISKFFGLELATNIKKDFGTPKLIVANNVMAHVPDLNDFVSGFAKLCGDETLISVENPTMLNLIKDGQFDTIYHEHFSYLSAHAVQRIVQNFGLELIKVDKLKTHGGSNRYWIAKKGLFEVDPNLTQVISEELNNGLLDKNKHKIFRDNAQRTIEDFRLWVETNSSRKIIGYGAAAKGATLLNSANVSNNEIVAILDASPEKQNKYLPGCQIPIFQPDEIRALKPDDVLVLPWNIVDEITGIVLSHEINKPKIWTAVPKMKLH